MREVTLGMIQLEPKLGDVPYNRTHSIELIRHAAAKGAQIIVLPETSLTGWDAMEYCREAWYEMAEDLDGESVTQFRILAKELGVYLVVGMALRTNQPPVMENAIEPARRTAAAPATLFFILFFISSNLLYFAFLGFIIKEVHDTFL